MTILYQYPRSSLHHDPGNISTKAPWRSSASLCTLAESTACTYVAKVHTVIVISTYLLLGLITHNKNVSHSHDQMAVWCPTGAGALRLDNVFLTAAGHCHGNYTLMHERTPVPVRAVISQI